MTRFPRLAAALATAAFLLPVAAFARDGLSLMDPFARVTPQSGAVYLYIRNEAQKDDKLIAVRSPAAKMMMPMTMKQGTNGMMEMVDVPEGFAIPAGGDFVFKPGAEHLMLMGLTAPLKDGDKIPVTLTFANSGDITLTVPVMQKRFSAPQPVDTPYNIQTQNDGKTHTAPMKMDKPAGDSGN